MFYGISNTDFQKPFYMSFPVKTFTTVFEPLGLGWRRGGPAGEARVRAPMRGTGKHPERLMPKSAWPATHDSTMSGRWTRCRFIVHAPAARSFTCSTYPVYIRTC